MGPCKPLLTRHTPGAPGSSTCTTRWAVSLSTEFILAPATGRCWRSRAGTANWQVFGTARGDDRVRQGMLLWPNVLSTLSCEPRTPLSTVWGRALACCVRDLPHANVALQLREQRNNRRMPSKHENEPMMQNSFKFDHTVNLWSTSPPRCAHAHGLHIFFKSSSQSAQCPRP